AGQRAPRGHADPEPEVAFHFLLFLPRRSECLPFSAFAARRALMALLMPYDSAAVFTSGPPSVAVNTDDSAETLPVTVCALDVMPSTRSRCVLTCVMVSLA